MSGQALTATGVRKQPPGGGLFGRKWPESRDGERLVSPLLLLGTMLDDTRARVTGVKVFRPEVEAVLKTLGAVVLLTLLVLPLAWGYQQRSEARAWREIACAYRLKEALSDGRLITPADLRSDPCDRLDDLGLRLARRGD